MERSRKIRRQLRKAFDTEDTGLLLRMVNCPVSGVLLSGLENFIDQVDASYARSDEKLKLAARSLQICSDELTEANRELEALNAAMRTMLGGLGQGLLMFGRDGLCSDMYSSACLTLFGEPPAGRSPRFSASRRAPGPGSRRRSIWPTAMTAPCHSTKSWRWRRRRAGSSRRVTGISMYPTGRFTTLMVDWSPFW
jgi:hypothetical protein